MYDSHKITVSVNGRPPVNRT